MRHQSLWIAVKRQAEVGSGFNTIEMPFRWKQKDDRNTALIFHLLAQGNANVAFNDDRDDEEPKLVVS